MLRSVLVAVASVAGGLLAAAALDAVLPPTTLFLGSVVLAAWFGGVGAGLLAAVLSTVAFDYVFIEPYYQFTLSTARAPALVVFALCAAFISWASAKRRAAEQSLKDARDATETQVRERTAELKRANEALEDLAGRLIHAQEEERSRIGRELHDHVSQRLGVLAIKIDQLRTGAAADRPEIGAALDRLRQDTSEVTHDIHRLSHRLHSSMLDHLGLVPALHKLVGEFSERHNISIAFTHAPSAAAVRSDVALCLFRIVEESLTNIVKHSGSPSARVDVSLKDDAVHLLVEDAGCGFDTKLLDGKAGLGFVSMRERLRLVHGTLRVESVPLRGTRLEVSVPAEAAVNV
jgi:signal transduction histidine kinase